MEYFLSERGTDDRTYVMYVVQMYKLMCVFIYDFFYFFELFFHALWVQSQSEAKRREEKNKICKTMDLYHIGELFFLLC